MIRPPGMFGFGTRDLVTHIEDDSSVEFLRRLQEKYDEGWELLQAGQLVYNPGDGSQEWEYWAILKKLVRHPPPKEDKS